MESTLRPRDIQRRVRAGESPEAVATAAGTTVDRIMGFVGPALAERAYIAQTAQQASLRRRGGGRAGTLSEATAAVLSESGLHAEDVDWDAARREDGRWTLRGTWTAEGQEHTAELTYDVPGRFVVAENDAARRLTGDVEPTGRATSPRTPGRRLASVPLDQDELPLGDDALEMVREADAERARQSWEAEQTPPGSTLGRAPETAGGTAAGPGPAEAADETDVPDVPADRPERADGADHSPTPTTGDTSQEAEEAPEEPTVEVRRAGGAEPEPASEELPPGEQPSGEEGPARQQSQGRKRRGRASVPSWDEIMFGGKPDQ